MKKKYVRFLGEDKPGYFLNGKIYEIVGEQKVTDSATGLVIKTMYRIIDESGEGYMYSLDDTTKFEFVSHKRLIEA
jgi:hypothetical protein